MKSHELAHFLLSKPDMDIIIPFDDSGLDQLQSLDGYSIGKSINTESITLRGEKDKKERKIPFNIRPMTGNNPFF